MRPMWKLFQLSIFVGVLFGNVHWEWTPNPVVASAMAFFAAFGATHGIIWIRERLAILRHRRAERRRTGQQQTHQEFLQPRRGRQ